MAYHPATILDIPIIEASEPYTVQDKNTGDIKQFLGEELLDHDPTATITSNIHTTLPFPYLPWIQDQSKATLYLPQHMKKPKQGFIILSDKTWSFHPGRSINNKQEPIQLPNFELLIDSLIEKKKLNRKKFTN